ncbi:hypothetical protein FOXB_02183 [Fusarium oxysporum f. sp. conglutinans Fo5176]|uniref:Uncharacterized protein n=1 Tax=Fusarium oxysporum (strain Fo5176) TaxID=660025 RepID=F9F708_FUSOF|nr:hypothetical protein FOXB_02183 [Fusarium oxysporum f. sp. conglutinans Fo5176]
MSTTNGVAGWAQLRQQARQLETQFSTASNVPPKPTEEERETERKLEELLEKRETVNDQLTRLLDSEPNLASSASKQNNLSLLRRKLTGHQRDLARLRSTLQQARDRANLLTNVRSDIDEYRQNNPEAAEADYMLEERNRIDNSNNMADSVLSQAVKPWRVSIGGLRTRQAKYLGSIR